ncbi:DNA primase small subunit PriS [Candidatus Bathyarchaeota archaeon]|nr:DNA primase small subunit PriS [Candidatus Bathyarchaeota archaeon]
MDSRAFVENMFHEYYTKDFSLGEGFPSIEKREFGFASFNGWMLRHKGFKTADELELFLRDSVPYGAYFSCAYYEDPEADMSKKGWLGADLIFDVDADHIPTPCNKIHDEWVCGNCGFAGRGIEPEKCPSCSSEKIAVDSWPCEVCIKTAKVEIIKLVDFLINDFGFSKKEIRLFFSGHRGYHVYVQTRDVEPLDAIARKEITDYICGRGLSSSSFGLDGKTLTMRKESFKALADVGWRRRIIRGIKDALLNADERKLASFGFSSTDAKAILGNREKILMELEKSDKAGLIKGIGPERWEKMVNLGISLQSAKIDTVVTTDVHRLIRLDNSLHGKTGFKKVEISMSAIDDFDPFTSAVAFSHGEATVSVSSAPAFRLGNEMFGPYKDQKVKLPTAAAMLLVCKGRAKVIE